MNLNIIKMRQLTKEMNYLEILRFILVGFLGFVVNAVIVNLLHNNLHQRLIVSEIIAAESAIFVTFMLHNYWTYKNYQPMSLSKRFIEFNFSAMIGTLITLATVVTLASFMGGYHILHLMIGAGLALCWNLLMNRLVVWKSKTTTELEKKLILKHND